jgi:hypothetical protein
MSDQQDFSADIGRLSDEDRQIEHLLASMVPRESRVNRDRVMFLAGQASALSANSSADRRSSRWIWPASIVCAACAGLMLGAFLPARHPIVGSRVVVEQQDAPKRLTSGEEGTKPPSAPQVASAAAVDLQPGFPPESTDRRSAVDLHEMVAKGFPLLAFRDRMLADHGDGTALAQADPSIGSDDSTTDVERPLGARALFERWIEDEGPAAR